MAKDTLGLVFFPAFDWMISPGHPERQERLLYTRDQLEEEGLFDCEEIREYRPRLAQLNDLQRVHIGVPNIARLITPAHLTSAGGCLAAADAVMQHEVKRAFALVRPPGHHAMRVVHGIRGFCTVNIEAIMVEYLRSRYNIRKIAVVDTDVHHGDGSQDVFYHDPDTLYISFHQDGRTLYPGTGFPEEAGSPAAWGTNINLPLLPGTGDKGLHRLYDGLIAPILEDFAPELIINSAGQDNHFSDPLASMQVTAQGYARLADKLKADIAVLEGGYSIESALPYVNTGIILAMAGMDYSKVVEPDLRGLRPQDARCDKRVEQLIEASGELYFGRREQQKRLLENAAACGSGVSIFIMMRMVSVRSRWRACIIVRITTAAATLLSRQQQRAHALATRVRSSSACRAAFVRSAARRRWTKRCARKKQDAGSTFSYSRLRMAL